MGVEAMQRAIRSFVLRAGRISPRQQFALDHHLEAIQLPPPADKPWCLEEVFGRSSKVIVEIGFGMGASLLSMAQSQPETDFVGIEVHRAGIGSLAADLNDCGMSNVRIAPFDAVEVFSCCFEDQSLDGVQIFFPDPWPKKRHHKRRLVQERFIHLVSRKIKPGGFIHCATDWEEYAWIMLDVLKAEPSLANMAPTGGFIERPTTRPLTKFEQRGQRLGHGVWDVMFAKRVYQFPETGLA